MELSTFLTSEEKAEQGEELRTLAVTHGHTQVIPLDHSVRVIVTIANLVLVIRSIWYLEGFAGASQECPQSYPWDSFGA